jgi:hypothetical protein
MFPLIMVCAIAQNVLRTSNIGFLPLANIKIRRKWIQMFMLGTYMQHCDLSLMVPSAKIESKITKHVYSSIDTTGKTGTRQDTERKRTVVSRT